MNFYFAPLWRTLFTVLYFLFFGYFVLFYFDYIILGVRFIYYTLTLPTTQLTLDYLFWGASYVVLLVIPFSVSIYTLIIPFELMKKLDWTRNQKIAIALIAALAAIDLIILSDILIHISENQPSIVRFLQTIKLIE